LSLALVTITVIDEFVIVDAELPLWTLVIFVFITWLAGEWFVAATREHQR